MLDMCTSSHSIIIILGLRPSNRSGRKRGYNWRGGGEVLSTGGGGNLEGGVGMLA